MSFACSRKVSENLIAIAEQIARDLIKRKCFAQLLCRPFRRGMRGDIKMDYPAPVMRQHQKHVQHLEADRRHGEEVDGHQVLDVIVQEGTPGLRGRLALPQHVLGHAGLTDLDAQFEQFPVDMGCAPQLVFTAHPADQIADLARNAGPTYPAMPDLPGPEKAKSLAMPGDRGRGWGFRRSRTLIRREAERHSGMIPNTLGA